VHFTTLAAGAYHTCGLDADGKFHWFGSNGDSQNNLPDLTFTAIAAGAYHTCGLDADGQAQCWGNDDYGQTRAPSGVFTAITAGKAHACVLDTNGLAHCFGDDNQSQTKAPVDEIFTAISAGVDYNCGIRAGDRIAICWGEQAQNLWR